MTVKHIMKVPDCRVAEATALHLRRGKFGADQVSNSKLPTRAWPQWPRQTWHHSPIHFCHAPFWQRVCIGAVTPASLQIFIFLMVGIGNISILNVLYNYKTVSIIHCIYLNIYFEQMGLWRFIFYVEIECANVYLHYINQPLAWKYFWISFEEGKLWYQVDLFIQFHQYYLWCVWQQNEIRLQAETSFMGTQSI